MTMSNLKRIGCVVQEDTCFHAKANTRFYYTVQTEDKIDASNILNLDTFSRAFPILNLYVQYNTTI